MPNKKNDDALGPLSRMLLDIRQQNDVIEDCFVTELFDELRRDSQVGGMAGIVEFTANTHAIAKASKDVRVRMKWIKTLLELATESERVRKERQNLFSDEELHQRMVAAVIEEIRENPTFATVMVIEAVKSIKNRTDYKQRVDKLVSLLDAMKEYDFTEADLIIDKLVFHNEDAGLPQDQEDE